MQPLAVAMSIIMDTGPRRSQQRRGVSGLDWPHAASPKANPELSVASNARSQPSPYLHRPLALR